MRTLWKSLKIWLLCVAGGGLVCGVFNVVYGLAFPGASLWPVPRTASDNPIAGLLWFMFVGGFAAGFIGLLGVGASLWIEMDERRTERMQRAPKKKKKRGEVDGE